MKIRHTLHPALRAIAGAALGLALVVSSASISHAHTEKLQAIEGVDSAAASVHNQIELQGLELDPADVALVERGHELVSSAKVAKNDEKKIRALADALASVDEAREDVARAQEAAAAFAKDAVDTEGLNTAELNEIAADLAAANEKVGSIAALYRQTPGDVDLAGKVEAVEAAVKAEKDRIAAEKKAAEEKAAAERAAEQAAAENAWQSAEPPAGEYVEPAQQQAPVPAPAAQNDCRAHAESVVRGIAPGATVLWDAPGSGLQVQGFVALGENVAHLSGGTNPEIWCSPLGEYVSAHEAAHIIHGLSLARIQQATGISISEQDRAAEQAADCYVHARGFTGGSAYGCSDPVAKRIAAAL